MAAALDALVTLLALERTEENVFVGQAEDLGWGRLYGGHVLGQALSAATQTVPSERLAHSLHAYFLRPGDVKLPITYEVDRIRDGFSFTTRRVVAWQDGRAILNLAVSFQTEESGLEHQDVMPVVPPPESLRRDVDRVRDVADRLPPFLVERLLSERPFDVRTVDPARDVFKPEKAAPQRSVWLRTTDKLADEVALHQSLLVYASDNSLLTTALLPHGVTWLTPKLKLASLDHVMWFHRRFRVDDWLLHVMDSPVAHGARALSRGRIFDRAGHLVASTAQEGLVRPKTTGAEAP
jgi:acyl-CoA thioesterase-2